MNDDAIKKLFQEGFNCSQIVFSRFSDELGIEEETAKKIASCFGGSMECTKTCGAVTGALMAIGMKYGNYLPNTSPETKKNMKEKVDKFNELFLEEFNSTLCKDILGYDLKNPNDMKIILENDIINSVCPGAIAYAIEVLDEIM